MYQITNSINSWIYSEWFAKFWREEKVYSSKRWNWIQITGITFYKRGGEWEKESLSQIQIFVISISLQPCCVHLWYFILRLFDLIEFIVSNIKGLLRHSDGKIKGFENRSLWQRLNSFRLTHLSDIKCKHTNCKVQLSDVVLVF